MSGVAITLTFEDTGAAQGLAAIRRTVGDLRPVLNDIGAELETSTLERFETNIAPDGTPWVKSLHSKLSGMPTLVEHGYLRDSVHFRVDGQDAVEVGEGGIAADYAAAHQFGVTITGHGAGLKFRLASGQFVQVKSVTLPARPSLGLSEKDRAAIPRIVGQHLARAAGEGLH